MASKQNNVESYEHVRGRLFLENKRVNVDSSATVDMLEDLDVDRVKLGE